MIGRAKQAVDLAAVALVLAGCSGGRHSGCVLRSVDKTAYVKHNEGVLRALPIPARARPVNTYSIGIPSPDSCLPHDTGPPYSAYDTWHVYTRPPSMSANELIRFYLRKLRGSWTLRVQGAAEATFRRGQALVYITASRAGFELSADYRGYAGRGH